MRASFFCYDVDTGYPFCVLNELPDNYDTMWADKEVIYKGHVIARGVKFGTTVDWFFNSDGFEYEDDESGMPDFRYIGGVIV